MRWIMLQHLLKFGDVVASMGALDKSNYFFDLGVVQLRKVLREFVVLVF